MLYIIHFYYFILSFLLYRFFDSILILYTGRNGRWFKLHAVANFVVVGITSNDIYEIAINPYNAFQPKNHIMDGIFVLMIHVYHCIYFKLKPIDYPHHIISVFIPTFLIPNIHYRYTSLYTFIGSGLPGGLNYIALSMVKNQQMDRITEKQISSFLNAYIRIPGGIIATFLGLMSAVNEKNELTKYCIYTTSFLTYYNVVYFGKMAMENYGENKYKLKNI
jgi:hypothetical protein